MKAKTSIFVLALGLGVVTVAVLCLVLWLLARREVTMGSENYFIIPHFSPGGILLATAFFSVVYFGLLKLWPKFRGR